MALRGKAFWTEPVPPLPWYYAKPRRISPLIDCPLLQSSRPDVQRYRLAGCDIEVRA